MRNFHVVALPELLGALAIIPIHDILVFPFGRKLLLA